MSCSTRVRGWCSSSRYLLKPLLVPTTAIQCARHTFSTLGGNRHTTRKTIAITIKSVHEGMRLDRKQLEWEVSGSRRVVKAAGERVAAGGVLSVPESIAEEQNGQGRKKQDMRLKPKESEALQSLIDSKLYEDDHILVLNKPYNIPVQGGSKQLLHIDRLLPHLVDSGSESPRLVHRLDKETTGVLTIAKSRLASAIMSGLLQRHSDLLKKTYWAFVTKTPTPSSGRISSYLTRTKLAVGQERVVSHKKRGNKSEKLAITIYDTLEELPKKGAWLEMIPVTGRTHQLRVHCADNLKTPILGDAKYTSASPHQGTFGIRLSEEAPMLHLHAREMSIPIITSRLTHANWRDQLNTVQFERVVAPLPSHMLATWKLFGWDPNWARQIS